MAIESVKLDANSSMIKTLSYHYALERLTVRFNDDSIYVYSDVPSDVVLQIQQANSTGIAFNSLVRHQYNYHKVSNEAIPINGTQKPQEKEA